ncbi:MAG: GT4 family glycosyltransferase PelF [Chlamydiota bacterium]
MVDFPKLKDGEIPDICYIAEGTYPYITGGVSSWTHDLIKTQSHLTFHIVCILPPDADPVVKFDLPPNVVGITNAFLQILPEKQTSLSQKERTEIFTNIEMPLINMQHKPHLSELQKLLDIIDKYKEAMGKELLLNSKEAWNLIVRMYNSSMGETSFSDYFWSWRGLFSGLFSILLADLPLAKVYHSSCTGYSGLYISRCFLKTDRPCMVTEHGIYTNERMIQLTASDWLHELTFMNFAVDRKSYHRDLKDLWMDLFSGYAFLAYQACERILTLYEGNIPLQVADGASLDKIQIIPNGVDIDTYGSVERKKEGVPVAGLIGRAVPIKDVKTFIKAANIIKKAVPESECWVLGPIDEDPIYYEECAELVAKNSLEETFKFIGKVNIKEYLSKMDIMVLTSISEAQPLTILEAGAAGIPFVSTNVGCCSEYAWGRSDEDPNLGEAGIICPLANPQKVAEGIIKMMRDKNYYEECGKVLKERIIQFYSYESFVKNYKELYDEMVELSIKNHGC